MFGGVAKPCLQRLYGLPMRLNDRDRTHKMYYWRVVFVFLVTVVIDQLL